MENISKQIEAFESCWRRYLRVPWTARRSNQSILKEVNPGCSLKVLIWKLKLQYFGHLMQGTNSLEKPLTLGKIVGKMRRGQQRMRWIHSLTDSMDINFPASYQEQVTGLWGCHQQGCMKLARPLTVRGGEEGRIMYLLLSVSH